MNIKAGIGIHNTLKSATGAVSINSGTEHAIKQESPIVRYSGKSFVPQFEEGAILPKSDWRPLNARETKLLSPSKHLTDVNTVYLGKIPESLVRLFKKLNLNGAASIEEVYSIFRKDEIIAKQLNEKLNVFLNSISNNSHYYFRCFGFGYPNLKSSSGRFSQLPKNHSPEDAKYIGLHNDCTTAMSIHTVHKFGNRIAVNIGREPREFIFVNLTVIQAYNMIKAKTGNPIEKVTLDNLPESFFNLFPNYPVLKIKLEPFQYYIAPTNNCFHDGRTLGNQYFDITMVFFGAFVSVTK